MTPDDGSPLVRAEDLSQHFGGGRLWGRAAAVRAVEGVSLELRRGETLGLVGESGSGKSTLGRALLRATAPTAGRIAFDGRDITALSARQMRPLRPRMGMIFQDPFSSLNPRMTVGDIVAAPLVIGRKGLSRAGRRAGGGAALADVGLPERAVDRYPHEFSGGQRQRIGIARALVTEPDFLVADEPVSALDVSIQAQVVNLLTAARRRLGFAMLFISHDLAVVGHVCDRIAVMYLGRIVEVAEVRALFAAPRHPYTEALFAAVPIPDPTLRRPRVRLKGDLPSPLHPPSGCAFRGRCPYALPACAEAVPPLRQVTPGHHAACIRGDLTLVSPLAEVPAIRADA